MASFGTNTMDYLEPKSFKRLREMAQRHEKAMERHEKLASSVRARSQLFDGQLPSAFKRFESVQREVERIRSITREFSDSVPRLGVDGAVFDTLQIHERLRRTGVLELPSLPSSSVLTNDSLKDIRQLVDSGISQLVRQFEESDTGQLARQVRDKVQSVTRFVEAARPVFNETFSRKTLVSILSELLEDEEQGSGGDVATAGGPHSTEVEEQVVTNVEAVIRECKLATIDSGVFARIEQYVSSLDIASDVKALILGVIGSLIATALLSSKQDIHITTTNHYYLGSEQEQPQEQQASLRTVSKDGLVLREKPRGRSRLLGKLSKDQVVFVAHRGRHWSRVIVFDISLNPLKEGYVLSRYTKRLPVQ